MLVLTRKPTETIRIGRDIEIRIVRVSGGRVKVGVVAPKETKVLRGELEEDCNGEAREAA